MIYVLDVSFGTFSRRLKSFYSVSLNLFDDLFFCTTVHFSFIYSPKNFLAPPKNFYTPPKKVFYLLNFFNLPNFLLPSLSNFNFWGSPKSGGGGVLTPKIPQASAPLIKDIKLEMREDISIT